MTHRSTPLTSTLALVAGLSAAPALAEAPILVTNTAGFGEGSIRAALAEAAATGAASRIVMQDEGPIAIAETLEYDGTDPLEIIGAGNQITAAGNFTVLAATEGADLTLRDLMLSGPGGFDIENRGDMDGPAGKGIFVGVRDGQEGTVTLRLSHVSVHDVAGHGIHVSDCDLADDCGGGGGGAGAGSPASIVVEMANSLVENAGNGRFDADGLRVDERGAGDITLLLTDSRFAGVGADGLELDEGQDGDVMITVLETVFEFNGNYCAPDILDVFLPEQAEGEFADGDMSEDAVPGPVTGSPDDSCIEREVELHESGMVAEYEFGLDLDDGFDVDEAGPGSISVTMVGALIRGNVDEGFDFDEEGDGGIDVTILRSTAEGNTDDGYKLSEEDAGDITGTVSVARAFANGGVGFVFEEADAGDVTLEIAETLTFGNDDGETGLELVQEDAGAGRAVITESSIDDGIDAEGVEVVTGD